MNDYSEIIQVMGAMLLVSILINNANRTSVLNKRIVIEGEYETEVTAIAQDIMEESRVLSFDETTVSGFVPVNIPEDFSTLGIDSGESSTDRSQFDDFDNYDGWKGTITTRHGDFDVEVSITYLDKATYAPTTSKSTLKKMDITLTSSVLTETDKKTQKTYSFSYIRSYYAD